VASRSIGPGTRKNIDEFTRTTAGAVEKVGGARRGKAIIIINPAEPPMMMRDTIHCLTVDDPDQAAITASALRMIAEVQKYVPGYKLVNGPILMNVVSRCSWKWKASATTCRSTPAISTS